MYAAPSALELADTPQPVRFVNVDQILAKAASAGEVSQAISQINEILRDNHHIRPGQPDDFSITDCPAAARFIYCASVGRSRR